MKDISLQDRFFIRGSDDELRFIVFDGSLRLYKLEDDVATTEAILSIPVKSSFRDIPTNIDLLVWDGAKKEKRNLTEYYSETTLGKLPIGKNFKMLSHSDKIYKKVKLSYQTKDCTILNLQNWEISQLCPSYEVFEVE